MGFWAEATQSSTILLREGLEALLIIAALAGFLRRADANSGLKALFVGAALAVILSVVGAVLMALFLDGVHDDRIEAAVMAIAAALMLYMSGWLFLKQDPKVLMAGLKRSADLAISKGAALSFGLLAFLSVFREGAETVLFLHALAQTAGGWTTGVISGILAAAGALVVIFIAMQWFAVRIPLRPLFLVTSAFLFVMALKFVGQAVQELQEQLIFDVTPADLPQWLVDLGFNASWQAVWLQLGLAAAAVLTTAVAYFNQHRQPVAEAAPAE